MSVELLSGVLGAVVVVDLVLLAVLLGLRRRGRAAPRPDWAMPMADERVDPTRAAVIDPALTPGEGVSAGTYDRVVRVASWSFILAASIIVSVSDLWLDREATILAVLGIAGLFVLVAHDLLPSGALGRAKYLVEGMVAIVFVTMIVFLTGGARSPFFFAYLVVVAGAALVVRPPVTLLLALIAGAGYLVTVGLDAARGSLDAATVAVTGLNLTALVMLAYVAMVVAREQRRTRDAAVRLSTLDGLTGLANRGFFLAVLEREIERGRRSDRGFCLLMADLDDLKLLNDTYGHRVGDRALLAVSHVIRQGIRRIDTAARLGGDEFVVLLPETDPTGAFVVAEKMRQGIAAVELNERETWIRVGASIGLVSWPGDGRTVDELMAAVDAAMYLSKRRGKNRVVAYAGAARLSVDDIEQPASLPIPIDRARGG